MTGRVAREPSALVRSEILEPQFAHDRDHLFPFYVRIERALVSEYRRMGLLTPEQAAEIGAVLSGLEPTDIDAVRDESLSDVALAIERVTETRLDRPVATWHADRSRNDIQACAQVMFARDRLHHVAGGLLGLAEAAHAVAGEYRHDAMPGQTHHQAAQFLSPGLYFAAVVEQVLATLRRFLDTYDGIDRCPLGAGALVGQHLAWDRARMARELGFRAPHRLAITSVADRTWALHITGEADTFGVAVSRICTDLIAWGSTAYRFLDLPDEMTGISASMPQKRNFPVLERIRGRTAHLHSFHLDAVCGQRNTPFTNLVEVSKEAGRHVADVFADLDSIVSLLTAVVGSVTFDRERMWEACRREFLGAFGLANALTVDDGVPWRTAQVVVGSCVKEAFDAGLGPAQVDGEMLARAGDRHGVALRAPAERVREWFGVTSPVEGLEKYRSPGSTHPDAIATALEEQSTDIEELRALWRARGADTDPGAAA